MLLKNKQGYGVPSKTKSFNKERELHKKLPKDYYKRYNSDYSLIYQEYLNKEIMDYFPNNQDIKVLDLGCGTGFLLKSLIKKYNEVYGMDVSPDMLKKINIRDKNLKKLAVGDAENIKFPDNFFDVIVYRGVLHHLENPELALNEAHRVLKKGGSIVALENCSDSFIIKAIRDIIYRNKSKFSDSHKSFNSASFLNMFETSNFEIKHKKRIGYIAFPLCGFPDIMPILSYIPFRNRLTKMMISLDNFISLVPFIKKANWEMLLKAEAVSK